MCSYFSSQRKPGLPRRPDLPKHEHSEDLWLKSWVIWAIWFFKDLTKWALAEVSDLASVKREQIRELHRVLSWGVPAHLEFLGEELYHDLGIVLQEFLALTHKEKHDNVWLRSLELQVACLYPLREKVCDLRDQENQKWEENKDFEVDLWVSILRNTDRLDHLQSLQNRLDVLIRQLEEKRDAMFSWLS